MGSTGTHREPGLTDLQFFTREWPDALGEGGYWKVLAHNSRREAFYAAIEDTRPDSTDRYFILIVRKIWTPRAYENFNYRSMTDSEGPSIDGASLAVINAVPATTDETARKWREKVLRMRAQDKQIRANLKDGATVELPYPLNFADGVEETRFRAEKGSGPRVSYRRLTDNRLVRLPQEWKTWTGAKVTAPAQ